MSNSRKIADLLDSSGDVKTEHLDNVDTKVAALVDSAPATLNTLNELAAALGDDADYASTVATALDDIETLALAGL